jgi:multiple sugar transport system permease protein
MKSILEKRPKIHLATKKKWIERIKTVAIYFLLIVLGFVFLYPIIYMISVSVMSNVDLVDNTIRWIPSSLDWTSYRYTIMALDIPSSYLTSILITGLSTIVLCFASALIGYGLARFRIPFKKVIFGILIFSFIMPKTLFFIPTYQIFTALQIKGTLLAILLPAFTGQGLQGSFFILIFYQFFKMIPKQLEESAVIDGANHWRIFWNIAIPLAVPAFIIAGVYSFSLYWSETFLLGTYLDGNYTTITMLLNNLEDQYNSVLTSQGLDSSRLVNVGFTESKLFAGTLLSIIPLMVFYIIVQKWFVESIDKSGITGE